MYLTVLVLLLSADLTLSTGRDRDGGFILSGRDSSQQLIVTKDRDLTREAKYSVTPTGIVAIDATGLVIPLQEGKATITATFDTHKASLQVTVTHLLNDLPINFASDIVPIFTKFGCNAGGCHGKASGQNGFKLSLLGFEPEEDHEYLVKEARGRRIFPAAPEYSLLLRKAVGQSPHGGGKKLSVDSPFYRILVRWIAQGMRYGTKTDPVVNGIEVYPRERIMVRESSQQLIVIAKMSDGSTRDVTRMAQFESNQPDMAEVSDTGWVTTKQLPGRPAVMVRFQSHVDVFRATVPLGVAVTTLPRERTFIDRHVFAQLKELGLPPSPETDDATFFRRVSIDLCGRLPFPNEVTAFVSDTDKSKHEKLVDRLLASSDHADYFANKWSNLLRNRRASDKDDPRPNRAFYTWIREAIEKNKPFDQFARDVLTASGEEILTPSVVWFRELKDAPSQVEDAAQLFLGQRIGCAKCHHHPLEKWSQEDYFGMVSFFTRVKVTIPPPPKKAKKGEKQEEPKPVSVSLNAKAGDAVNPRTGKPVRPTGLGGKPVELKKDDDPRLKLVEWMTARDNPFFAKTLVNRYWKHFMGRGLVDPEDDLRVTNPSSNPALLMALENSFIESKYDVRMLIRTICTSTVYRLSAVPNEHNVGDRMCYSRFLPRRLHAEVLLDAIDQLTSSKTTFKGVPNGTRAVQLPDNLFESYFLSVFGRPDAASACECERSGDASLAQALHMLNSAEIQTKVSGQRSRDLAKDKRTLEAKIREIYLVALSREPTKDETSTLVAHLNKKGGNNQSSYEDILWALINTKEFLFNH